jgi:hypothetical protein
MLSRWHELRELIVTGSHWQAQHKLWAVRLLGHQPLDATHSRKIAELYLRSWTIYKERDTAWLEFRSELNNREYRRFLQRVRGQWGLLDSFDKPQERAKLLAIIEQAIADVQEKLVLAQAREAREAAIRAGCLGFDDSPEGERLRRYELAAHRKFVRSLDSFMKVRKEGFEDTVETRDSTESVSSQEPLDTERESPAESEYCPEADQPDRDRQAESDCWAQRDQFLREPEIGRLLATGNDRAIAEDARSDAIDPASMTAAFRKVVNFDTAALSVEAPESPRLDEENLRNDPNFGYKAAPSSPEAPVSESKTNEQAQCEQRSELVDADEAGREPEPAHWLWWLPGVLISIIVVMCFGRTGLSRNGLESLDRRPPASHRELPERLPAIEVRPDSAVESDLLVATVRPQTDALRTTLRLDGADRCADAVDPDGAVFLEMGTEAADWWAREESGADRLLGVARRSPVEPFVEIERERLLDEADVGESGASKEIDQLAAREVAGVRAVAGDFEGRVVGRDVWIGVGDVIAQRQNATASDQLDLPRQERFWVDDVMQHVPRDCPVKRAESVGRAIKHRCLEKPSPLAEGRAPLSGALDHFARQVHADDVQPGAQKCFGHEAGTATDVEDATAARKRGFVDQALQCGGIALDGCALKPRSLGVESASELCVVVGHVCVPATDCCGFS